MPKICKIRACCSLTLANFALQLPRLSLGSLAAAPFDLPEIVIQMRQLFDYSLNFFGELLPLRRIERNLADGARHLHPAAGQLALSAATALLVAEGNVGEALSELGEFLVQRDDIAQRLLYFGPAL